MSLVSLATELKEVFGDRLAMVATFGGSANTCAIVRSLSIDDLDRCAALAPKWSKAGLGVPLLIVKDDLPRALDAFPLELTEILATRQVVAGEDLLANLAVPKPELRRACESGPTGKSASTRPSSLTSKFASTPVSSNAYGDHSRGSDATKWPSATS